MALLKQGPSLLFNTFRARYIYDASGILNGLCLSKIFILSSGSLEIGLECT